ncbi:O-linked N-acetylglucosamine transferase OGT [Plasmopara halstedii]|uniref:O-linked N-acetylglucosamine transferase OGT n=1 Tax=Plasmopara halstedii TaxID=4781 RepID=A0A0P1AU98_PLAHL|nr:O-linked N-acetylglucosamine transferase OGT [Plasmopara halstedii]CEG44806.1 O-linked N-acetylglucosamine transferase OGT [Plasmopara halstedii]|eukprot:XP_024581175.1 O-linked N-acetylglucosamine transferase OGT [Plasmopara halstedii]
MASPVVIALYRFATTLQRNVEAGRTLYDAVRSGAVASYTGIKSDWQRERMFVRRFEDMGVFKRHQTERLFASIVRAAFAVPVEDRVALDARIDAGFEALKSVDDHNALLQEFETQEVYNPKVRTDKIKFRIGDIVEVKGNSRGVIFSWHLTTDTQNEACPCVAYDILPHSPGLSFASKLYNVPQDELRRDESHKAVVHPALLLYFDTFDGTHHIPSKSMAARYPKDFIFSSKAINVVVTIPSILQLESANEDKLLMYLQCNDSTTIQLAIASLEGIWSREGGSQAQSEVQRALMLVHDEKKFHEAREILQQIVHDSPSYAYAWNKLAMIEYKCGHFEKALEHYETAVKFKPAFIEALVGLGTCGIRLQRWTIVHHAAVQLLEIQPSNETAKLLLEQAIFATL